MSQSPINSGEIQSILVEGIGEMTLPVSQSPINSGEIQSFIEVASAKGVVPIPSQSPINSGEIQRNPRRDDRAVLPANVSIPY